MSIPVAFSILLALLQTTTASADALVTCLRQLSTCSCETAEGVIDLSPLSSPAGFPFSASVSSGQDTFQWSPCVGQLCGNQLDTAVCELYGSTKLPVGQSDSAKFVTDPAQGLQLMYTDSRIGTQYTSYVTLVCDPSAETAAFSAQGGIYVLHMHLRSKYACPGGGGGGDTGGSGMSTGDVLCIILIVCIVLYLSGGLLLNKFLLGKEGIELVPNKDFWVVLPGYVKDGCLFAAGRIGLRSKGSTDSYEALR